jgi:MFS family permease
VSASRPNYNRTFAVLALAVIVYASLQSLVVPALPIIQRSLHMSEATSAWILTAFLLSASVGTPILGRLGDMYGRDRVLQWVLVMLAFGTLISAVATSPTLLIAGRVIQGSSGAVFPLSFAIVRDEFPADKVPAAIGFLSALGGVGLGLGAVLAGVIVIHLSYHWLFWFPLVLVAAALVLSRMYLPRSPVSAAGKINWLSAALMSGGLTAVLVAITETTSWGWVSGRTIGLFAVGSLLLASWIINETRARYPLVDLRIMRRRAVWTANLNAVLLGVGMYCLFILVPQYVQEPKRTGYGFGASLLASGLFMLPMTAGMLLVGRSAGPLARRFGSRSSLMAGSAIATGGYLIFTLARSSPIEVYFASFLLGAGINLGIAAMTTLIVHNVPQDQTGVATGVQSVARMVGGAVGAQVAATFLADQLDRAGLPSAHAYTLAFGMCAVAMGASTVVVFLVPRSRRRIVGDDTPTLPAVTVDGAAGPGVAAGVLSD